MNPTTSKLIRSFIKVSSKDDPVEYKRQYDILTYHHKKGDLKEWVSKSKNGQLPIRAYIRYPSKVKEHVSKAKKKTPASVINWKNFKGLI